jgi:hypothetical protein
MRAIRTFAIAGLALSLAACAAQPPPPSMGNPGFWWGFLHGIIAPFSLIGSFFDPTIRAYAAPNAGWWYDLGFIIGIFSLGSGAASQS